MKTPPRDAAPADEGDDSELARAEVYGLLAALFQAAPSRELYAQLQVAATQASLVFNGLGRLAEIPPGNVTINITNPAGGACIVDGGEVSCLRIVITTLGQARMCNPDPGLPANDPRRC